MKSPHDHRGADARAVVATLARRRSADLCGVVCILAGAVRFGVVESGPEGISAVHRACRGARRRLSRGDADYRAPRGKSLTLAICAAFLAVFKKWPGVAGERKVIIVCASTARQARSIHNYCRALITEVPALAPMLIRETATELDLDNGISIVIEVADYRSVRGTSICAALLDEVAFWQAEGASPDKEVVTAVKAGMGTMPGAMLLIASSPYARRGILWENRRRYFSAGIKPGIWSGRHRAGR